MVQQPLPAISILSGNLSPIKSIVVSLFRSNLRNPFLDFGVLIDLHFAAIEGDFAGLVIAGNIPD